MAENTIQKTGGNGSAAAQATSTEATREPERFVTPPVDIYETSNGLTVLADLPGATSEDIDIGVEDNVLTIKALTGADEGREPDYREYALAPYFRQFTLGQKIDQAAIRADYRNGVLTLVLPFAEKAKPRRIAVQAA